MDKTTLLLKELTEAFGAPGYEQEVRKIIRSHLEPIATIEYDNLGSIIARKNGTADSPRIMLAGHMDEIAFMVSFITKEGYIKFVTLGGWWEQVMLAQRVVIRTRKGDVIGITGSKPPHILSPEERKKVVQKQDMFIDVGASSEDEVRNMGIRPGDPIVPLGAFTEMNNKKSLLAKAWDDRVGCAMVIEAIQGLVDQPHPNTVYGVGTVQEEVGLRGARTAVDMVNPDVAFALEVDIAGDTPGTKEHEAQVKLGKGPSIVLYDASMVPHMKLRDLVIETAEKENIPYQLSALPGGGTDAGAIHIHARGVPSLVLSVPCRYIHSHTGIINKDDYQNALRLLLAVIRRLDKQTVEEMLR